VDMDAVLAIQQPKRVLSALLRRKQMPAPVSRLLRESGRASNSAIYLVGVYSGTDCLARAVGSSIRMAEHRACKEALRAYYMHEVKDLALPSDVDEEEKMTFYVPGVLGDTPAVL